MGFRPSVTPPVPNHVTDDSELFTSGNLFEDLKRELERGAADIGIMVIPSTAGEGVHLASAAELLPVEREGFSRGDVASDGKDEGVGAMLRGPVAIELRERMTGARGLAVVGEFTDADVVGDSVHGDTS